MANDDDPLRSLLIDADAIDRKRIAETLAPYAGIDTKRGTLVPKAGFDGLSARKQVLVALLVQKVAVLVGKSEDESLTAQEVASVTGLPLKSVRPRVTDLVNERTISRDDGRLSINAALIPRTLTELALRGDETDDKPPRRRSGARKRGVKKTAKQAARKAAPEDSGAPKDEPAKASTNASKKRATGQPGPMSLLRGLVDSGFFATRRSLSDVKEHLRNKHGRSYASTTLSPAFTRLLREGVLDREKSADGGAYEYFEKKG